MHIANKIGAWLGTIALAVMVGCGDDPDPQDATDLKKRPDWVDGASRDFPEQEFMSAVGRGVNRTSCENDAYAALARRFETHIRDESTDVMTHFSKVSGPQGESVETMDIDQLTQVSTDYVLRGAHVAGAWQESVDSYHCLAVLERRSTARNLTAEIEQLDAEITGYINEGDKATAAPTRFMKYKRAAQLMQRREALNAELRLIDRRGQGVDPVHSWQDVLAKLGGEQGQVKIGLTINGKDTLTLQTCFAEELTKRDIQIIENSNDVDLLVRGDFKSEAAGKVSSVEMVRSTVNLRLLDAKQGSTLAAFSESVKYGRGTTLTESTQFSEMKLCKETAPKLVARINDALGK